MPTLNTPISAAWTKIAAAADTAFLATWHEPVEIEVAATTADAAPTVRGHRLTNADAITRDVIGAGHVWMRTVPGSVPAAIAVVVTK